MTQVSRDTVVKLASLSSLMLSDSEVDDLTLDLERILGYVKQLDELDTDGVEPAYQVTGLHNVWREDIAQDGEISREQLLAIAPDQKASQIKVPKVL